MAENPGGNPLVGIDKIGSPAIGTQGSGLMVGSKWQMAIAVPIRNRKFSHGTNVSFNISNDQFNRNAVDVAESQVGLTAASKNAQNWPSGVIQYGDKALLGPSSNEAYENYRESVRVAAVSEDWSTKDSWDAGVLYLLDRRNKYSYELTDKVSVYGTGRASAWEVEDGYMMTAGLKRGYRSLNRFGLYSALTISQISKLEDSIAPNYIALTIQLPSHSGHNAAQVSGPLGGPSVFFSEYGLYPWRDPKIGVTYGNPSYAQDNTWDWRNATTAKGKFRYILKNNEADSTKIAYESTANPSGFSLTSPYASVLTGYYHVGGQYKDHSQALYTRVDSNSLSVDTSKYSIGVFRQYITSSDEDALDLSYSPIIGGTYYRLGITWRGTLRPTGANSLGSELWAKFQWGPLLASADVDHAAGAMISTSKLLDHDNPTQDSWAHNTVTGFLSTAAIDYLSTDKNIKVEVIQKVQSPTSYTGTRQNRGAEMLTFVDNIWLEHQGDLDGTSGYLEVDHYPELGTLQVNTTKTNPATALNLSDGTVKYIDPSGTMFKDRYIIEADFMRVPQALYNNIRKLLQWQDRGHLLTLHPFLPGMPHCLVGKLTLSNESKNHWDLTRFNFRFRFEELD